MTGVIYAGLTDRSAPLPDHLHAHVVTDDQGVVNGILELHTSDGEVRMTIALTETPLGWRAP